MTLSGSWQSPGTRIELTRVRVMTLQLDTQESWMTIKWPCVTRGSHVGEILHMREPWKLWKCLKSSSVLWICWLSWVMICFLSHVHDNVNSRSLLSARQIILWGFSGCSLIKDPLANAGDERSVPRSERSPGERNCFTLRYSCLENSMDRWA